MILVVFVRNVGGHVCVGVLVIERLKQMMKGLRLKMRGQREVDFFGEGGSSGV